MAPIALHAQTDESEPAPAFSDEISEPSTPDWSRIDDSPDSTGQVLELPQVVAVDGTSADATADAGAASSDDTAARLPSVDGGGDLGEYTNRMNPRELALSPPTALYPSVGRSRFIAIPPSSVIIVRPGGLSPIPATSPLLMTPRGSGPVFGGWWHRVH
jgi:hypothetical protein